MIEDSIADCPFCAAEGAVLGNELAYARYDRYPVTPGHLLIIPRRHVADFFDVTDAERAALWDLAGQAHALLQRERNPDGFNIGINVGAAAGQTVFHVHMHLIPRYRGDVGNPRGGVRGVIPAKQSY
jgi:diadenosine tetraphosphate (Ap4A) HIT family hydrolase